VTATSDQTPAIRSTDPSPVAFRLEDAELRYGERVIWTGLDLAVRRGEFLAVLGPNGSGKTSLLRVLLGLQPLSRGTVEIAGRPPHRGSTAMGYIPQQKVLDPFTPMRPRDLVRMGMDGHRWGLPRPWRTDARVTRRRVEELLDAVGASAYADVPLGLLSGGEQQRVRVAQALATDPRILLCDEPLLALDMQHRRAVSALIDQRRRTHNTAVVFVTHEINPVLGIVDRVLYLVDGRFRIGRAEEVMTSATLSELYGTPVDVLNVHGRLIVVGAPDAPADHPHTPRQDET
jgi:zinc/manganese transport system ATP-binding protein